MKNITSCKIVFVIRKTTKKKYFRQFFPSTIDLPTNLIQYEVFEQIKICLQISHFYLLHKIKFIIMYRLRYDDTIW